SLRSCSRASRTIRAHVTSSPRRSASCRAISLSRATISGRSRIETTSKVPLRFLAEKKPSRGNTPQLAEVYTLWASKPVLPREKRDMTVKEAARRYTEAGLHVIPIRGDGSKQPALKSWKEYQSRLATMEELDAWFDGKEDLGVAILGANGVEVID